MNLGETAYTGTEEELREIHLEITRNQRERAVLDAKYAVLQEHRMAVYRLLHPNG